MDEALPYRTLAPWLEARFRGPVHRVALDAGSSCPNRDGTKGFGGCTYCDVEGSGTGALKSGLELARQLETGLARVARRGPGVRAIAYFQSYSNTYVSSERLDEVLAVLEPWLERADAPLAAVSLATRPDTLPDEALRRLERLAQRVEVWVELGLETASDAVQQRIRRFHTLAECARRVSCAWATRSWDCPEMAARARARPRSNSRAPASRASRCTSCWC